MTHFLRFFFDNPDLKHWYEAAVWSNVVAIAPCAAWVWFKHRSLQEAHSALRTAHVAQARKLDAILNHLDPEAATDGLLDLIADRVDHQTPGGVGEVYKAIKPSVHTEPKEKP